MGFKYLSLFLFLSVVCLVRSKGYYSIVAPGTIRPYTEYNVAVSTYNTDSPSTIRLELSGPRSFSDTIEVNVPPHSTELVKFDVPHISYGTYTLKAEGISGIRFKNETDLNYSSEYKSIFIQTDKATYKPGDLVRFRVLFLDSLLLPRFDENSTKIFIKDPQFNTVMQFKVDKLNLGVYENQFQLSHLAPLHYWDIIVDSKMQQRIKSFEVAEYVLPKFEVTVEVPDEPVYPKKSFPVIVKAKYTYGKYVDGEANLRLTKEGSNAALQTIKVPLLNGKAVTSFEINYNTLSKRNNEWEKLIVRAEVTDRALGLNNTGKVLVPVHDKKYILKSLRVPKYIPTDRPFTLSFQVTDPKGIPIQDRNDPVKLKIILWGLGFGEYAEEKFLNKNGVVTFKIEYLKNLNSTQVKRYYAVSATISFKDETRLSIDLDFKKKSRDKSGGLFIDILNENPSLREDIKLVVESHEKMKYLIYQVIAGGKIVLAERIEVPDTEKFQFKFTPTSGMAPKAIIFVYYISGGELYFVEEEIEFVDHFKNFMSLRLPREAGHGENINITVTTEPGSYVGLLGVDHSVLLKRSGNDLDSDEIMNYMGRYKSATRYPMARGNEQLTRDDDKPYPGEKSGLITMTNAQFPYWKIRPVSYHPGYSVVQHSVVFSKSFMDLMPEMESPVVPFIEAVRKEFPETWLWESIPNLSTGKFTFNRTVPDTITSWVVTGFSVNREQGLALDLPKKLLVFKPFFITLNLPYSVINGEVISVPVIIFNYMNEDLEVEVTMYNEDQEFVFTEATNDVVDSPSNDVQRSKNVLVPEDSTEVVHFMIRPKKVGKVILKVNAVTPIAGDAIEKVLLVKPEGVTKYFNKGFLVEQDFTTTFDINVPENVVPNSTHIEVSVASDILGPSLNNLRRLIRIPSGCGEQNMVKFVPNYLILEYLEAKDQLNPDIEATAIKYLQIGYQGELRYKHGDGSFSAFGSRDRAGCTWLTAYVARSFKHASKYIKIEERIIKDALDFLVKHQEESGRFVEVGYIFDKIYASAGDGDLVLTAYALLSFLDQLSDEYEQYQDNIKSALDYIARNRENTDDIFSIAIVSYVLQLAKHEDRHAALDKLLSRAIHLGDKTWWGLKSTPLNRCCIESSADVEITSYALLAILESDQPKNVVPIVKWLLSKQDSTGGFGSTQNTVVGLQALVKFAEKFQSTNRDFKVIFKDDLGTENSVIIDGKTAEYLRIFELSPNVRRVSINTIGQGSALAQISYEYNIKESGEEMSFLSSPKFLGTVSADTFKLEVCTKFIPKGEDSEETNMAVMEVGVPSGYVVYKENLKSINEHPKIKKIDTKNDYTVAVFYFDNLSVVEICPKVEAHRVHKVAKQKPSPILVYDYYNSARKATFFYESPNSGLCGICEGKDCGYECEEY